MTTFDSSTLKLWIEQNADFLKHARIQKIQQPSRRNFIFTLRNFGLSKKLYIDISPQFCHVCFLEKPRHLDIPKNPPMFCMLLRKYIENARISKINQPIYERILEIYFETYNELNEKIYLCLAIELMGKHSNVVLYNCDTNIILGCAHNVGAEKSRYREMAGGLPYTYPPKNCNFWYTADDSFTKLNGSLNSNIDNYFAKKIYDDKFSKLKEKYLLNINKKIKKAQNSISKLNLTDEQKYRRFGDLIMANLYNNNDFQKSITVFDYENNKNISVPLNENMTLKENANRFYKLYNKAKTANSKIQMLTQELNAEISYLNDRLYFVQNAQNIEDLYEPEKKLIPVKKTVVEEIKGENYTIFVGKNNKQNDYIVSKLAKDSDLWFHTKDCAGSHVLLRTQNITDDLILKCAKIAKEHSAGAKSSKIGVIYTFAKYLKKPPKANLGYVTYSHEKEIVIGEF